MGARLFGVVFVQVNCDGAVPGFSCLLPALVLRKSSDMKCCEQTRVLPVICNISNVTAISSRNFPILCYTMVVELVPVIFFILESTGDNDYGVGVMVSNNNMVYFIHINKHLVLDSNKERCAINSCHLSLRLRYVKLPILPCIPNINDCI